MTEVSLIRTRTAAIAAAAVLMLGLAACGSSSSVSSSSSAADALPKAKPATGSPITLAMINDEGSPAISFPELREGAQAAVQFVNNNLGGVDGHPLKLVTCISSGSPSSSAGCANRLIDSKPVAFVGGTDVGSSASLPIIEGAGLAYIGGSPFQSPEMTKDL
jgi:branched-chain amino acid transport system substrate-binding protein